ncbi:hypothetical protein F5883DRAFT_712859 [Diaporthe sp. PMI_573]|nr:hypothetical protein F5883DRAFT_712859 [Diaporthaceae sp. PMI_573]
MFLQFIFPATLALLVHTLISSVTGIPTTASAIADTSSATSNTYLPWPSYLPGWGSLTVSRDLLADEYAVSVMNQSGAWDAIPSTYAIYRLGNDTCDNPYHFPNTHAVKGALCLPEGEDYDSMAKNITGKALAELGSEKDKCGCYCKCNLGCVVVLIFWALCAAGCEACPDAHR